MGIFTTDSSYLGVDMGSTGIKLVELKKERKEIRLVTYGFSENSEKPQQDWQKDIGATANVIKQICDEAGATSRNAISALPTFSVFSSVLNLSNIAKKDIAAAVHWEAKKVIPLPLEDMVLDWKEIEPVKTGKKEQGKNLRVLLTGAPKTLIDKYRNIFISAKINLLSLETETFSLIRSLVGNDKTTLMLVEFGASTTDVTIVDRGIPMMNRSIDVGGIAITKAISRNLGMEYAKAEQFKYDLGVSSLDPGEGGGPDKASVPGVVSDTLTPIINEIKYAVNLYESKYGKKTEKIILSGGSALLPGFAQYLSSLLNIKVIIGDPWTRVAYPDELRPLLNDIGPRLSVAIGLALREIE